MVLSTVARNCHEISSIGEIQSCMLCNGGDLPNARASFCPAGRSAFVKRSVSATIYVSRASFLPATGIAMLGRRSAVTTGTSKGSVGQCSTASIATRPGKRCDLSAII